MLKLALSATLESPIFKKSTFHNKVVLRYRDAIKLQSREQDYMLNSMSHLRIYHLRKSIFLKIRRSRDLHFKFMQYIVFDAIFSFLYFIPIDNRNIVGQTVFEIIRIMKFFSKIELFYDDVITG